jgi:2-hydroxychromene-2-carboxylate isomerase
LADPRLSVQRTDQPIFFYELGSPRCYLVAEQILSALPVVPEWVPVVTRARGASLDRSEIERRAGELGLQPLRWPERWPPDGRTATLAATYAKRIGRGVAFSLAAFRQAFAAGRDLDEQDTVLIAGAACEMHPAALLKGIALRSVAEALDHSEKRARAAGVSATPAIQVGGRLLEGETALERASIELDAPR